MAAKIGIMIIHGIGITEKGFSNKMVEALSRRLGKIGVPLDDIAFKEIFWQDIVQSKQDFYRQEARNVRLNGKLLRGFFLNFLADATMYQKLPSREQGETIYEQIHKRVHREIKNLERRVEENAPLIMMAHSMGGHVMSNYIWDRQKFWLDEDELDDDKLGKTDFQSMKSLASFITFGCNIPLFVMATEPYEPIKVPSPSGLIPQGWSKTKKWLNFYDRDDVLGWPLRPLAADENDEGEFVMHPVDRKRFLKMVKDLPIDVGLWFIQNWNPFSHLGYWDDRDFINPVADHVRKLHGTI